MKNTLPMLVIAIVALGLGGAVGWYMADSSSHGTTAPESNQTGRAALDNATPLEDETEGEPAKRTDESKSRGDSKLLKEAREELAKVKKERDELAQANKELSDEASTREARITELETQLEAAKATEVKPVGKLYVPFGKWADIEDIREADWKDLGDAVSKMSPLLAKIAEARAAGEEIDPVVAQQIQTLNRRLISHYAKVMGKLPTNSNMNGEFTHPINMVNILAGELENAGQPLSENQLAELVRLGDEYDRRWDEQQKAYGENTYVLQKSVDEADLKQWFYEEMFKVTTQQQKTIAVPPAIEGMIGLDLYSPGLMLQGSLNPLRANDLPSLKTSLKDNVSEALGIDRANLDTNEYVFDDWLNALSTQLQPQPLSQANQFKTLDAIRAGKAQLVAMHALEDGFVSDEATKKKIRATQTIVLPQLLKQE
ncbi:MAG: hypothetical protein R3E76_10750 [Planctomycetota bacterium]